MNNTTTLPTPTTTTSQGLDTWTLIQFTTFAVVFILGVTGNALVVTTVMCNKKMRTLNNYFIVNLALSNLITLVLQLPITVMGRFISWQFGEFFCRYLFPIFDVVPAASALTLVCISLDRYRIISRPLSTQPSRRSICLVVFMTWFVAYIAIGLPLSFGLQLGPGYETEVACILEWPSPHFQRFFIIERTLLLYILPVIVTLITYILISTSIRSSMSFVMGALTADARLVRLKRQERLVRMLLTIFVVYALFFLPINVFAVLQLLNVESPQMLVLFHVSLLLTVIHCCCNPVILYVMSKDFRRHFRWYGMYMTCNRRKAKKPFGRGTTMASSSRQITMATQLDSYLVKNAATPDEHEADQHEAGDRGSRDVKINEYSGTTSRL